jgi:signal transduction histidine kinase
MLKLILAFLLVSLAGTAVVAVLAGRSANTAFDRYRLIQDQANFMAEVSAYYQNNGSWQGVDAYVRQKMRPFPPPPGGETRPNPPPPPPNAPIPFVLVDRQGRVVIQAPGYRLGQSVSRAELERGSPILVEGQVIGTVLSAEETAAFNPQQAIFKRQINQALLIAALAATIVALLLAVILARNLTRPLRELTKATQTIAEGELGQQVVVRSQDELGELADAFNRMSRHLAEARQLRRQMTADVAHDLRNPLMVITGYIESLREGVLQPSPAMFEAMYSEAHHLQRLVEDLRTLSLADAHELSLNRQWVAPQAFLKNLALAYMNQTLQQSIALHIEADPELPDISIDPERMAQVVGNLISNALRFTPAGGQIVLAARQQANVVILSVRDSGMGIAPEKIPHIFHRFYRADESRPQNSGESGLGLAIAKSIVEAHGGSITVESELGRGTTFTIRLPMVPAKFNS